jgi:hypothetical protein
MGIDDPGHVLALGLIELLLNVTSPHPFSVIPPKGVERIAVGDCKHFA